MNNLKTLLKSLVLDIKVNMKLTAHQSQIRSIKPGDRDWMIRDNVTMAPRAGFEILQTCPKEYRMIIAECLNQGWLQPVAHVTEKEFLWMNLSK